MKDGKKIEKMHWYIHSRIGNRRVQTLDPVFEACPGLAKLTLASCRDLRPDALDAILPLPPSEAGAPASCKLPVLRLLDVSYCPLPTQKLSNLLYYGTRFEVGPSTPVFTLMCTIALFVYPFCSGARQGCLLSGATCFVSRPALPGQGCFI